MRFCEIGSWGELLSSRTAPEPRSRLPEYSRPGADWRRNWTSTPTGFPVVSSRPSGTVYLSGRLVLDSVSYRLSVQDFDYELATKDHLQQVADWLVHDTFVQRVQERLPDASRLSASPEGWRKDSRDRVVVGMTHRQRAGMGCGPPVVGERAFRFSSDRRAVPAWTWFSPRVLRRNRRGD
jgi:hypothetical protein